MGIFELLRVCIGDSRLVTVESTHYESLLARNKYLQERNEELEAVMVSIKKVALNK